MPYARTLYIGTALMATQVLVLYLFRQPLMCTCGYIKAWEGIVLSPGNSQHLTDWYSFSHIIHGFIFYGALRLMFPNMSVGTRLLLAMGIEVSWEIAENTPMVIQHYREQALALGYTGDSIINSVSDTCMMIGGFLLARRLPIAVTIATAFALEIFTAYMIRDNLTLNILNLIHVFPAVAHWQLG